MPNDNQELSRMYVYLTRRVAMYIINTLVQVERDAWSEDETGMLDRMNPELEETHWMSAVIRVLGWVRHILQYNMDNPIHRLIIAGALIEDEENDTEND